MSMPRPTGYRDLDHVARKLSQVTVNLQPAAFLPLPRARALVARVLRCVFLPLESLDGGASEHAFWSCCALLHALDSHAQRLGAAMPVPNNPAEASQLVEAMKAGTIQLDDADLVRCYRAFLAKHEDRLSADEAAFLTRLGVRGVHLFNPSDRGTS
jgi:hypothetical protein